MTKQELTQFLVDLSSVFPISSNRNAEKTIEQYTDYLLEYCYNKELDFKKVTHAIIDDYKKQYFPEPSFIRDRFIYGEIKRYQEDANEGKLLVVTLPNGIEYQFTYSSFGKSQRDVKADIMRRFGECDFKLYPAGTVIVGDKVFEGG